MKLPHLSIATKLYAIFALLATVTVALAAVAVVNARRHAALTDEFESRASGAADVAARQGLIYAMIMESRGIYVAPDLKAAKPFADEPDRTMSISSTKCMAEWRSPWRADDADGSSAPSPDRLQISRISAANWHGAS